MNWWGYEEASCIFKGYFLFLQFLLICWVLGSEDMEMRLDREGVLFDNITFAIQSVVYQLVSVGLTPFGVRFLILKNKYASGISGFLEILLWSCFVLI